jgi:ATP-dependent DNA helicase RecG
MQENQHIEWKESWRDDFLKTVCGFANAEGGVLVIGRSDKGEAVGVKDARKLMVDIPNKVRDVLGIMVEVNLREEESAELVEIVVEPYPYPISYKGEYYIRSGSTCQELKGAALDRFLLRKVGRHWDGVPVPYLSVADLDAAALRYFRKKALTSQRLTPEVLNESDTGLLDKLHLLDGSYLKRAAALLFYDDPERFVTGAYVKIGFFETNADLRYHDEVHGDLFSQVNKTIEVMQAKYLKALITYEGLYRVETWPVPDAALREAVLNAVVHKDYGSAIPIQISVYPDKVMIWNPGQLPPEWTVSRLVGKHSSEPYNPDVANAFFRAGQIESWGRGIERMMEACTAAGAPEPEFEAQATGLWTVFHFLPEHVFRVNVGDTTQETPVETLVETTAKTTAKTTVKTTAKTPERIVELLRVHPELTLAEVAESIGRSLSAVQHASAKLVKEGRLRYVGPSKGGHWEVLP